MTDAPKPAEPFDVAKLAAGWTEASKGIQQLAAGYAKILADWTETPSGQYCLAWSRYYSEHPDELEKIRNRYSPPRAPRSS